MRVTVGKSDLELIRKYVVDMLDPELEDVVKNAEPKGARYELTFEERGQLEAFIDAVAGAANHEEKSTLMDKLDRLVDRLEATAEAGKAKPISLPKKAPHPNEMDRLRLEQAFVSPVPDKLVHRVEAVRSGYILYESRPHWQGGGEWTRSENAKILWSRMDQGFNLYWKRGNGKWMLYGSAPRLEEIIQALKKDENGCFFG